MADCDCYVNVAGGMRVTEPAIDLAMVSAIISSYKNVSLDNRMIFFGEVGLTGEVRGVNMVEQRVAEAAKMGFEVCVMPKANIDRIKNPSMKLIGVRNIQEIMELI